MKRFCTSCGQPTTQEASNLFVCKDGHRNFVDQVPAAVVYVMNGDKFLFGYRSIEPNIGKLNTPGGFLNLNETAEKAALREVHEEFGINVKLVDYLGSYAVDYADSNKPVLCITFVAEYQGDAIVPGDDMSGGDPIWRSIDDLPIVDELSWSWQIEAQEDLKKWYQNLHARANS
jgi:NADH pyrophosphatase NudC (nudix superfamily)